MLSIYERFDKKIIEEMEGYIDSVVNDIPNDSLSMWYVFYKWNELHGDDLVAFARYTIEKAIDYGAVPARDVWLKRKDGQEKRSVGLIKCKKCGERKDDIIDYVINVWISLGDKREFFLDNVSNNGILTPEEYKTMDIFLWGLRFALPDNLSDYSEVDPEDLIQCENDIWGI